MSLFDHYIAVDWSANAKPKGGANSIWISQSSHSYAGTRTSNPRTRSSAIRELEKSMSEAIQRNEKVIIGFDFPFGYPTGSARLLAGTGGWLSLWEMFGNAVVDDDKNRSNRFSVASALNERFAETGCPYWGCPESVANKFLSQKQTARAGGEFGDRRRVEIAAPGASSVWKLYYPGSVGSQAILGMARLWRLRRSFLDDIAVWPFETEFSARLERNVVFVEIYPSLLTDLDPSITRDQAQVEAQVRLFAELDVKGELRAALAAPPNLNADELQEVILDEGWIFGLGTIFPMAAPRSRQ